MDKRKLIELCKEKIQLQINDLQSQLEEIAGYIANETKSSAGDKYETSIEMLSQNRTKISAKVQQLKQAYRAFDTLPSHQHTEVKLGSLVFTTAFNVFIGVSIGEISFDNKVIHTISYGTPFSKAIQGLEMGDEFFFNGKNHKVEKVW